MPSLVYANHGYRASEGVTCRVAEANDGDK